MAETAYVIETEWLHDVLTVEGADVFFWKSAEDQMRLLGITRPEIVGFLRDARIVDSDREDTGWRWVADGEDTVGRTLRVILEVESNTIRIEVIEVMLA